MIVWDRIIRQALCCAVLFAAPHAAGASQPLPAYDVRPGCQSSQSIIASPESESRCLSEEQEARAQLEKTWTGFSNADRQECVGESSAGGSPSYADLLACLQMTKDDRALRRKDRSTTGGDGDDCAI